MRFNLEERFYHPKTVSEKEKWLDEVWDILVTGYEPIGGLKGVDREDLMHDEYMWKIVLRKGRVSAVAVYRISPAGDRKAVCASCDLTPQGKNDLRMIMREDVKMGDRHVWAELSGAPEHMSKKAGMNVIPNDAAEEILNARGKKIVSKNPDGVHYTRIIGGEPHEKALMGYDVRNNRR